MSEDKESEGRLPSARANLPVRPSPVPPKLGLVSVLGTFISLGLAVWNWIKQRRRTVLIDSGDQKIQTNQGVDSDYSGLDDVQNGVYDIAGANQRGRVERLRDHPAAGSVLREQADERAGESLQRPGEGRERETDH